MIVPKGKIIEMGRRASFEELLNQLSESSFTGYVDISFKLGELSNAKVVFENGSPIACSIERVISKVEIRGEEAFEELRGIQSCVSDIYELGEEDIAKVKSWNPNAILKPKKVEKPKPKILVEKPKDIREVLEYTSVKGKPLIPEAFEKEVNVSREALLQKYGIKEPSPDEIDSLISSALETEGEIVVETSDDLSDLKSGLKEIANRYLGKISTKVVKVIDEMESENIEEKLPQIEKEAKKLVMFISREKIDLMLEEMKELLERYTKI
jgi:hypothetical protein